MKKITMIIIFIVLTLATAEAYDNKFVHQAINEKAAKQSVDLLGTLRILGFNNDLENVINGKRIYKWFEEGARLEDENPCRSRNHFHDPLKTWDKAGLNNVAINGLCTSIGESFLVDSSIIWAQKESGLFISKNSWSWPMAREYFYNALIKRNENEREEYLSKTMRSLGQVMHLLSDVSVPAHVRNDIHVFPLTIPGINMEIGNQTYESWAQKNYRKLNYIGIQAVNPLFSKAGSNSLAPIPISALWDLDIYSGLNLPANSNIGLAEYTNANFFSEDTVFKEYPHPNFNDTNYSNIDWKNPEKVDAEDGKTDHRMYIKKINGEQVERLAAISYLSQDLSRKGASQLSPIFLDDKVYEHYSDFLIPRAVGYSAGLLDYFFRGSLEITIPDNGLYSLIEAAKTGFNKITLLARNATANGDEMTDGSIELVVKYKLARENPFKSGIVSVTEKFEYSVAAEANNTRSIPKQSPVELSFNVSPALPLYATNIYLYIVYKGKLGNEDGAVALGLKDISEPTPVDLFNNMDKICLNGSWFETGSQEAVSEVDKNKDGIAYGQYEWDVYPHNLQDIYIKFSPVSDPQYASAQSYDYIVSALPMNNFLRTLYILTDHEFRYNFTVSRFPIDQNDHWAHPAYGTAILSGTAVQRQTSYTDNPVLCGGSTTCSIDLFPAFYPFRGTSIWWGGGIIFTNAPYPSDSSCSLNSL